jgi:hypothetical protein
MSGGGEDFGNLDFGFTKGKEAFMEAQSSAKHRGVRAREPEKSRVMGVRRGAGVNLVGWKGAREEILVVFQRVSF